ncbi:MAG: DUF4838 domain-containing protein, partial [Phycisphaeraceae bacterium]
MPLPRTIATLAPTFALALGAVILMASAAPAPTTPTPASALVLIADGQARAAIVLDPGASPSERWAASELQSHLRQMTGVELPITTDANDADHDARVYLGQAAIDAGLIDTLAGLGTDGFAIAATDNALAIAGSRTRGTMYGVFTLLHELGCRWWTPSESTIPARDRIAIAAGNRRVVPALEYRDMLYREMYGRAGQIWAARNRVNGMAWQNADEQFGGRFRFVGNLVHSYNQLMRESGLEIEPEMWALRDGERRPNAQPCLTHPRTLEAMTISVLQRFEDNPGAEFVVVGQNDNGQYCQCEDCTAVAEREGSQAGNVIEFANKVLANVQAVRSGARIATPAYQWSRRPPAHVRPHEDVIIVLCSIEADFHTPLVDGTTERNRAFKRDIEGWHEIADTLFIWDYTTNFRNYLMPHPNLDALVPNVRFFAEQGAGGVFEQGAHTGMSSEFGSLRMWILAHAMWDPTVDGDALIDEFLDGYYGPAADAIREYIDLVHEHVREHPDMRMGIGQAMTTPWVAGPLIAEAEALLRRAADAVAGDAELESRIRHARLPVWYVLAKRGPESRTWQVVEDKLGSMAFADIADGIARVHEERGLTQLAEGHDAGAWLDWLAAYADQLAAGDPPRPADVPAEAPRVIQAGHMDPHHANGNWLEPADGASDGWAIRSPTHHWFVRHHFAEDEDFQPGSTYRLMV